MVAGGGDHSVFILCRAADGAHLVLCAVHTAGGVGVGRPFKVVPALVGGELRRAGAVREIFFTDGAVPVGHVAGSKAGGSGRRDFRQFMRAQFAVFLAAVIADRFGKAGGRAAVAVLRDCMVLHICRAAGAGLGVRIIAVGAPGAVIMAAFGGVVAERRMAADVSLAVVAVFARGEALRHAVRFDSFRIAGILVVGVVKFAVGRVADGAFLLRDAGGLAAGMVRAGICHGVGGIFSRRDNGLIPSAGEVLRGRGSLFRDGRGLRHDVVVHRLLVKRRAVRALEGDGIAVDGMFCVKGDAVFGGCIAVARVAHFIVQPFIGIPANEGIPGAGGIGKRHAAHGAPDGEQIHRAVLLRRQVADLFLVDIDTDAVG